MKVADSNRTRSPSVRGVDEVRMSREADVEHREGFGRA
jgi:hypothetical protein